MNSSLLTGYPDSLYKEKLMECAGAIAGGDLNLADSVIMEIKSVISAETNQGRKKLVNYYTEALVRRVYGIHPPYPLPSLPSRYFHEHYTYVFGPFDYFAYHTTKNAIKAAFGTGSKRLHVIHFSIVENPLQWECLMEHISAGQPGGLSSFRLKSVVPKLSINFEGHLYSIRHQLTRYMEKFQIDFELRQLVADYKSTDDVVECCMSKLRRTSQDEMLVVLWSFSLHSLLSQEGAMEQVLLKIKDLKPDMAIIVEQEANHNDPDFLNRLGQSFEYYSSVFESLDKDVFDGYVNVALSERYFRRQIGNLVSCEGHPRVERRESLALWQQRLICAGFLPVRPQLESLKDYWERKGYVGHKIKEKDGHALLCRENCPLVITSIWKPQLFQSNSGQDVAEFFPFPPIEELDKAISFYFDDDNPDDPTILTGRNLWSIGDHP